MAVASSRSDLAKLRLEATATPWSPIQNRSTYFLFFRLIKLVDEINKTDSAGIAQ